MLVHVHDYRKYARYYGCYWKKQYVRVPGVSVANQM